jgi:hypothetical protein
MDINGYNYFNFYRKYQHKNSKRCSGGIIIFIKECLHNGISIVNIHDTIIWLKFDKNVFGLETDVFLAGVYIWAEKSPCYNVINVDLFELLQQDINEFQTQGKVWLIGDWNARVGLKRDIILYDGIVDFIDDDSYVPDLTCERKSMDNVTNAHGLKLIDLCKSTSLRNANGRLGNDHNGSFTFFNSLGSSVINYLLLKNQDFLFINNFSVSPLSEWSDHCALSFDILLCN